MKMIDEISNFFGLTKTQRNLTVIYMIGIFVQIIALCVIRKKVQNYNLIIMYIGIAFMFSITNYKLFATEE